MKKNTPSPAKRRHLTVTGRILRKYVEFLKTGYTKATYKLLFEDPQNISVIAFIRSEPTNRDSFYGWLQHLAHHYETFAELKIISHIKAKVQVDELVGYYELWFPYAFKRETESLIYSGMK